MLTQTLTCLVQNQRTLLAMVSPLFPPLIKGSRGIYREGTAGPQRSPEHALGSQGGVRVIFRPSGGFAHGGTGGKPA